MKKICMLLIALLFSTQAISAESVSTIYVYDGPGVSESSLEHTLYTLKRYTTPHQNIKTIGYSQVIDGAWKKDAVLFVMPGGADIPYCKHLQPRGNKEIRNFVEKGGAYLGICAGAYYGCQEIEFAKGTALEVTGSRDLAFFPGLSVGPYLAPYSYESNAGARAAHLLQEGGLPEVKVYYNGGGYFVVPGVHRNIKVLSWYASYEPHSAAAIVEISVGQGKVILSGPHFEYDETLLDGTDKYLVPIIADMAKTIGERKILVKHILTRLGVRLSEGLHPERPDIRPSTL